MPFLDLCQLIKTACYFLFFLKKKLLNSSYFNFLQLSRPKNLSKHMLLDAIFLYKTLHNFNTDRLVFIYKNCSH